MNKILIFLHLKIFDFYLFKIKYPKFKYVANKIQTKYGINKIPDHLETEKNFQIVNKTKISNKIIKISAAKIFLEAKKTGLQIRFKAI